MRLGVAVVDPAGHAAVAKPPVYLPTWQDIVPFGTIIAARPPSLGSSNSATSRVSSASKFMIATTARSGSSAIPSRSPLSTTHSLFIAFRVQRRGLRACAGRQGRFAEMSNALFGKRDSLGLETRLSGAREAGVPNTARFERCAIDTAVVPRVEEGLTLGEKLAVTGTPTVSIHGCRYSFAPFDSIFTIVAPVLHAKQ